ncbi:MAG TPA: glycoside hydrolase family 88 protein [Bacteroidales bacterium]|nr:glycoside hydrolase family 88 protein [Bacteroidales bacterium]
MKNFWHGKFPFLIFSPLVFLCLTMMSCNTSKEEGALYTPQEAGRLVIEELLSRPEFMMLLYQEQVTNLESGSDLEKEAGQESGSDLEKETSLEFGSDRMDQEPGMEENSLVFGIHYAEACAGFGAVRLAGALKDSALLARLAQRYALERTDTVPNSANHVDVNVYGILPLELCRVGMAAAFREQGMRYADGQWENPLPDGLTRQVRYWIDDIWMIASLQIQAFRVTGQPEYLQRAAKVVTAYLEKLQQPNGLFYHGTEGPFFWGRGNGWVASGLAELLTELPASDPDYPAILAGYRAMMEALLLYQGEDGLWGQLIDHPESFRETSGSAMFGYAMQVGVKRGLLPRRPYGKAVERAWKGLGKYLNEDGTLREVCVGTGQSTDINHYLTRPRVAGDLHGQAPLLWFAYSLLTP